MSRSFKITRSYIVRDCNHCDDAQKYYNREEETAVVVCHYDPKHIEALRVIRILPATNDTVSAVINIPEWCPQLKRNRDE